jgi:hypothetical protein
MMVPQLVTVRVHSGQGRRIRLWIPLLPVFILLSPLLVLVALVLVVACLVYRVNPWRALRAGWSLMAGLHGLSVEIQQGRNQVRVNIT